MSESKLPQGTMNDAINAVYPLIPTDGSSVGQRLEISKAIVEAVLQATQQSEDTPCCDKPVNDCVHQVPCQSNKWCDLPHHTFRSGRQQAQDLPPFVRGILETLADREWDPNDICADGGVTGLDVLRKDAQSALGR